MNDVISSLDRAIKSATALVNEIQPQINNEEIEDFSRLCQKYIEIQTQYQVIKKIENFNALPDDISENDIQKEQAENEQIRQQIFALQKSNEDMVDPEELRSLIKESQQTLQELREKISKGGNSKIDQDIKMAEEEIAHLDEVAEASEWYKAAYSKLSKFTGIEINDDGSIQIFGTHKVDFTNDQVILDPPSVAVNDLDPLQEPHNVIISEIIERIASLRDMRDIAQKLNWKIDVGNDAPIVFLHSPQTQSPAIFALIGTPIHPLVKWGNVNVDEFNTLNKPMIEKMKLYEKSA